MAVDAVDDAFEPNGRPIVPGIELEQERLLEDESLGG